MKNISNELQPLLQQGKFDIIGTIGITEIVAEGLPSEACKRHIRSIIKALKMLGKKETL